MNLKRRLAIKALSYIKNDMAVGVGSGRTVNVLIEELIKNMIVKVCQILTYCLIMLRNFLHVYFIIGRKYFIYVITLIFILE